MRSRNDLHPYQNRAVEFIQSERRAFLTLDMGLGKSAITLTAVSDMLDSFSASKVLVIGPLRVANSVWKQEAKLWEHLRHLDIRVCTGNAQTRLKALHFDSEITVINRENVPWLVTQMGKSWPYDTVVIDESSSFKSASTKRFKALKKVLSKVRNIVLLTGTPSPNGLLDLWSQVYLIDQGESLGRTMSAYKDRFFFGDYMGYKYSLKEGSEAAIHDLMRPYTLSMAASDYLQLPDRIDIEECVELDVPTLKRYKEFEKNLFLELDDEHEIEALNAATLANKLLQYANGAVYTDDMANWMNVHEAKLDRLEELVDENESETILVAYNFKSDLQRLKQRFPYAEVLGKDPETIERWNNGQIRMLLAHPQSAGHGLNLQKGGSWIVWFSLTWSLEYYLQFNGRLHRQGQGKPVRITHLIAQGTIDRRVLNVLGAKGVTQASLLDALK